MSEMFFSADYHFGHGNIIQYCRRPFKDIHEMERVIVQNHNHVVQEDDEVFVVGDFTLHSNNKADYIERVIRKMRGKKHLILGNHDAFKPFKYVDMGFLTVHTALEVHTALGRLTLVHDPAVAAVDRSRMFLCGHVHDLFVRQKNVINVGVDVWDFSPVPLVGIGTILESITEEERVTWVK